MDASSPAETQAGDTLHLKMILQATLSAALEKWFGSCNILEPPIWPAKVTLSALRVTFFY
jgi:hypothetical protein